MNYGQNHSSSWLSSTDPGSIKHGERGQLDYEDLQVMEQNFWEVAMSVEEFKTILKKGKKNEYGSFKIAVMGHSMGE